MNELRACRRFVSRIVAQAFVRYSDAPVSQESAVYRIFFVQLTLASHNIQMNVFDKLTCTGT